ncbi:pyridoxamine 5'-phosphate oxidase-like FMN-binding protein [Rhizobium grahamii CCGE 502]|uniref:Pyridoxamine 5'-phosphate oxidase-like FMN-binding protein n=2 Tax=Rhizobium grahamii TaxID=1120045 RepID=S3HT74_9HYPH|nr:pyridoxamine 5'-phosphate oxidase-like FMN-binding protein [Rhizobium grahamii CCGE 502]
MWEVQTLKSGGGIGLPRGDAAHRREWLPVQCAPMLRRSSEHLTFSRVPVFLKMETNFMDAEDDITKVWDLAEKIGFCMLTTQTGADLRARPMSAYAERMENAVYFLTDGASHKDEEIASCPNVCLAFADPKGQKYVSLSGTAEMQNDREKIRELWATPAKAWWDSPDDPSIRILKVTPNFAEFWDSPGTVMSYIKMAAAAVGSSRPDMGENVKVTM